MIRSKIYIILLLQCFAYLGFASVYTFDTSGDWTVEGNWDIYPGTTVALGDTIIIGAACSVSASTVIIVNDQLTLNGGGSLVVEGEISFNGSTVLNGEVIIDGTADFNGATNVNLLLTNNGLLTVDDFFYIDNELVNNNSIITSIQSEFYNGSFLVNSVDGYLECNGLCKSAIGFTNDGDFIVKGSFELPFSGVNSFINNNMVEIKGDFIVEAILTNSGVIEVASEGLFSIPDGSSVNNESTINIIGELEVSDDSNFENNGIINVKSGGNFNYFNKIDATLMF